MFDIIYNKNPLVSIITLNYNQTDVTCDFLLSTKLLKYSKYEIIICDMNSEEDPTIKITSLQIPNTRVYVSDINLGFAAGNNWGIKKAKGDFVFIVNNDTILTANLIDNLLQPFLTDISIGITCPKIKYYFSPTIIQYAGFNKMNMYTGRATAVGYNQEDKNQFDNSGYTYGAHGCAMMVSKVVIEKTGMFPEAFFLYYEEWDWSSRVIKSGFKIYYQAKAVIYHKESMTVGKNSLIKTYYLNRNRILYIRRNSSSIQKIVFCLYYMTLVFPKTILNFIINQKITFLRIYLKAIIWHFQNTSHSKI